MSQASHPLSGRIAAGFRLGGSPARYLQTLGFAAVAGLAAVVLYHFHDRFWMPNADGAYAHVAERILNGEVLNRDVQDIHAGYINFVNAFSLAMFGSKMVALRYPLVLLTLVQTGLVYFLLLPRGSAVAITGGVAMATLSFVQFLNPSANWYALFVSVTLIATLAWVPPKSRWRLPAVGFLLMTLFLFRQLSGVLMGIGVVTYLLCEAPAGPASARRFADLWLGRALLAVMGAGLAIYLLTKTSTSAIALFGLGPLAIIAWAGFHGDRRNRDAASMILRLVAGGLAALAPLLLYHLANGSVSDWIRDTVFVAFSLTEQPFFEVTSYGFLLLYMTLIALPSGEPASVVNGVFWIALVLLAPVTAFATCRSLWRRGALSGARPYLLPVLALFHALVAVHYQVPVYLTYTVALTLAALLWLCADGPLWVRRGSIALALFLGVTGLYFNAGQPSTRKWPDFAAGTRIPQIAVPGLEKAGLRISAEEAAEYEALVGFIQRETPDGGAILVLPVDPELYFLSGRRNPTRFFNSAFGVRTENDLQAVLRLLQRDPPMLVLYRRGYYYDTEFAGKIVEYIEARYETLPPMGEFEVYRYRPRTSIYRSQLEAAP